MQREWDAGYRVSRGCTKILRKHTSIWWMQYYVYDEQSPVYGSLKYYVKHEIQRQKNTKKKCERKIMKKIQKDFCHQKFCVCVFFFSFFFCRRCRGSLLSYNSHLDSHPQVWIDFRFIFSCRFLCCEWHIFYSVSSFFSLSSSSLESLSIVIVSYFRLFHGCSLLLMLLLTNHIRTKRIVKQMETVIRTRWRV